MSNKTINQISAKNLTPSSIVKKLTEALMVKTGIKAGPEFTTR
jgi:hypothetical protein